MEIAAGHSQPRQADTPRAGRRFHGCSPLWPIATAGLILYGSLLPFSFDWTLFDLRALPAALLEGARIRTADDQLTNLLVYVLFGLLAGCTRRIHQPPWWQAGALTLIIAGTLSLTAETLQLAIPIRVSSALDVLLNLAGAAIGLLLAGATKRIGPYVLSAASRVWQRRPLAVLCAVLTMALFAYHLFPFDFVTDAAGLHASFRVAEWHPFAAQQPTLGKPALGPMMDRMSDAAWFFVLGYLSFLAIREGRTARDQAVGQALREGVALAAMIEFLQLFTHSHTLHMTAIFLRILAVSFGIWCAVFFVDGVRPVDRRRHPIRAFPVALMIAAAGFQIITATLAQLDIMFFSTEILGPGTISWLPFVEVWRRPLPLALAELTDVTIRYGALAATIVLILHQLRRPGWWVAGAVIVLAACGIELIRACSPMSTGDVTRPLVAALVTVILARLLSPVVRRPEPTPA